MQQHYKYLTLEKIDNDRYLRLTANKECKKLIKRKTKITPFLELISEILEDLLSNTEWEALSPIELGALTSCELILAENPRRDDQGNLLDIDFDVYWFDQYQVLNELDEWLSRGYIDLRKAS
jgi:hypothetical protein